MPLIMRWLSEHITAEDADVTEGVRLVAMTIGAQLLEYQLNEMINYVQNNQSVKAKSAIQCMIMRKVVRQTTATAKNYDVGKVRGLKNSFHRAIDIQELTWVINRFATIGFCTFRLWTIFGSTAFVILALIIAMIYLNKAIGNFVDSDTRIEEGKKSEELNSLTIESFDSIRTVKQYGWDDLFLGKLAQLQSDLNDLGLERERYGYFSSLLTGIVPQLITPMTFIASIMLGNVIQFADAVELLALIGRLRWPLSGLVDL